MRCAAASVTVRDAVKLPAFEYEWLTVCPIPLLPSPKFHAYEYGCAPPLAEAVNVII
jgi:hypothetical protein